MEQFATDNLILLEFLVENVSLEYGTQQNLRTMQGEMCVSFQFLDNTAIYVCEQDFAPKKCPSDPCALKQPKTKNGKSCLFAMSPQQAESCLQQFDVYVSLFKKMKPGTLPDKVAIGESLISITDLYNEVVKAVRLSEGDAPVAKTLKDQFTVQNSSGELVGQIGVYIRMSCFGKLIVTQFQMNLQDKSVEFKAKEGHYLFKYNKKDGRCPAGLCPAPGDNTDSCHSMEEEGYGGSPCPNQSPRSIQSPRCCPAGSASNNPSSIFGGTLAPCCQPECPPPPPCPPPSCYQPLPCPPPSCYQPPPCPPPTCCSPPPCSPPPPCPSPRCYQPSPPCLQPPTCPPPPCSPPLPPCYSPPPCSPPPPPPCCCTPTPPCCTPPPPCIECNPPPPPDPPGAYQEIGAEMGGNSLLIRVHKDSNKVEVSDGTDDCSTSGDYCPTCCCKTPPPPPVTCTPPCDPKAPFCLKMGGNTEAANNICVTPPNCAAPDGTKPAELKDPNKEMFILRIGKKSQKANKKNNLELELCTPKAKEIKPPPKLVTQDTQCLAEDFPEQPKGKKGEKGKGKGKGGGKKGKK